MTRVGPHPAGSREFSPGANSLARDARIWASTTSLGISTSDVLARVVDVDELCFHERILSAFAWLAEPKLAQAKAGAKGSWNPKSLRLPDPGSGASASSATFAQQVLTADSA